METETVAPIDYMSQLHRLPRHLLLCHHRQQLRFHYPQQLHYPPLHRRPRRLLLLPNEASSVVSLIEEEAFISVGGSAFAEDDGTDILEAYSKEISKRMLDTVKSRSTSTSTVDSFASQTASSENSSLDGNRSDLRGRFFSAIIARESMGSKLRSLKR